MWYKAPIHPIDPVIQTDQRTGAILYYRDSFFGSGQESFTLGPAQTQEQWSLMKNCLPSVRGSMDKRWGYQQIQALGFTPSRAYEYENQANSSPFKKLVFTSPTQVAALNEDGTPFNSSIFNPTASANTDVHMVSSRSTAYFADGVLADYQKWDGSVSGGVSKWGIDINATSGSVAASATNSPGTIANDTGLYPWTLATPPLSLGNACIFVPPQNAPESNVWGPSVSSNGLLSTNCSFALGSGTVTSISFTISYRLNWKIDVLSGTGGGGTPAPLPPGCSLQIQFLKNGTDYGPVFNTGTITTGSETPYTVTLDLTGGAYNFTLADINAAGFGISIIATTSGQYIKELVSGSSSYRAQLSVTAESITVHYNTTTPAITVATGAAGNITLVKGRTYYYVFRNSRTAHMSDLSFPSASSGAVTAKQINLSSIPVCSDPQVDLIWILATADGGDETTLYFLAEIKNGTTTYTDNTPELSLLANNIVQESDTYGNSVGVADNTPPPQANFPIKYAGRLIMGAGNTLYVSKSLTELTTSTGLICGRYEEAWPATYQLEISDQADSINAIMTDGIALYVGTNRHVWRVVGTGPQDFSVPSVAFNETGMLSQEAATVIFKQGSPAGACWMTPDFRIIASDFNTYHDIGTPIQDVLNTINTSATTAIYAEFFSTGEYDLIIFAIPTGANTACDTLLVYDTRNNSWGVWNLADQLVAMLFSITQSGTPNWWLVDANGDVHLMASQYTADNGAVISSSARTTWLHLGMPAQRKYLNELELETSDPALAVTVEGADTRTHLDVPVTYVSAANPVASPLGPYKVFLAGYGKPTRWVRLTFSTQAVVSDFLNSYRLEAIPVHFL